MHGLCLGWIKPRLLSIIHNFWCDSRSCVRSANAGLQVKMGEEYCLRVICWFQPGKFYSIQTSMGKSRITGIWLPKNPTKLCFPGEIFIPMKLSGEICPAVWDRILKNIFGISRSKWNAQKGPWSVSDKSNLIPRGILPSFFSAR